VLADGVVVGRIFKANASPVGTPWMWTVAFGHHGDRTPTHGYAETREAAMAAFARRVGGGTEPSNFCQFQSQTPYRRWLAKQRKHGSLGQGNAARIESRRGQAASLGGFVRVRD
jgi:hypothetical protein